MKIKDWEKKTLSSKILTVVGFIISIAIIILSCLQIFCIWDKATYVFEPLLGILMIIQVIENWKINKSLAYFSLFVALFIFVFLIIIFFL